MTDTAMKTEATTTAATTTMTPEGEKFRDRVIVLAGAEVKTCIQCGTCSASCPTASLMDVPIRKLVKLVLGGGEGGGPGEQVDLALHLVPPHRPLPEEDQADGRRRRPQDDLRGGG